MRDIWKTINDRLLENIPVNTIHHSLNDNCSTWYWISGMNHNHSNFTDGGFVDSPPDRSCWYAKSEYIVDLAQMVYAKTSDYLNTLPKED